MAKIRTWLKLGELFIDQDNIRSVARFGKGTRISLMVGDDVAVDIAYEKVRELIPVAKR